MTARFLRDDVPPEVAAALLRLVNLALLHEARTYGAIPGPLTRAFVADLFAASTAVHPRPRNSRPPAQEFPATGSDAGTVSSGQPNMELTVSEAAALLGSSGRWVRRLVSEGRVAARRAGPVWLIDAADLNRYRHGRTAA